MGKWSLIAIVCFFVASSFSEAEEVFLRYRISKIIEKTLRDPIFNNVDIGIAVASTDGKNFLYSHNGEKLYIPASSLKLVIGGIVLEKLGSEHCFETIIGTDGELKQGRLYGNLYIKGFGDPLLTTGEFEKLALELYKNGLREIDGDLIYDTSYFEEEKHTQGFGARHFNAPSSALNINFNRIDIEIERSSPSVVLKMSPETSYARLGYNVNVVHTDKPGNAYMSIRSFLWGDSLFISGTITDWDVKYNYLSFRVSRPGLYAATIFREKLKENGIVINGKIKKGITPEKIRKLSVIKNASVKEAVFIMNRESNNMIAETLNKLMGAIFISPPGSREKGLKIVQDFLINKVGLKAGSFVLKDASGLSAENRFSPHQFISILNYFYKNKGIWNELIDSIDFSSNYSEMFDTNNVKVYCKSGTLANLGINTLAGYIIVNKEKSFSFVIFASKRHTGEPVYSGTLTNPVLAGIINSLGSTYRKK